MRQASGQVGEISATAYLRTEFPGSERVFGTPEGLPGRRGQFDQIWRQKLNDGSVRYIVVEAKGGASGTSTAKVNGQTVAQGTSEYFDRTLRMMLDNPTGRSAARQLQLARQTGRVVVNGRARNAEIAYIRVQTPIDTVTPPSVGEPPHNQAGTTTAQQFILSESNQ